MTSYKSEYVVQEKILGDWKDHVAKDTFLAAEIANDLVHFESKNTSRLVPETRIVFRETFVDIHEKVVSE